MLTGGEVIQLWTASQEIHEEETPRKTVKFSVGQSEMGQGPETVQPEPEREIVWETTWRCKYDI